MQAAATMSKPPDAMTLDAVRALNAFGLSVARIAEALQTSKGRVSGLIRRHVQGKAPPPRPKRERPPKPARLPKPKPAPPPKPTLVAHDPVSEPRAGGCHWPMSNGKPWMFCGAQAEPCSVYCYRHRQLASARAS
jgi:hypothetical protein